MNDDALSPELELASAYLDGDVDDTERAQVEASAELMAVVASLRGVKDAMRHAPAVDAAARDSAVAAALAEFDVLRAPPVAAVASVPRSGTVVPMRRRARLSRVLLSAAAVLLIGGVGVVAINSFGGSSSDDSSSADPAAKELASDTVTGAADDAGGAPQSTINAINGAASAVPALDQPEQLLSVAPDSVATTAAGQVSSGATETTAAATETVAATNADASPSIPAAPSVQRVVTSFAFDCPLAPTQVVLAEITWKGTPAVAVRDTVTGVIQAIDAQCTVLASVEP